jgi:hypothetical protein
MVDDAEINLSQPETGLLDHLYEQETWNLEELLQALAAVASYSRLAQQETVAFRGQEFAVATYQSLGLAINKALVRACDLPSPKLTIEDPLQWHRDFFVRLIRSRRGEMPRVKVFTTNYDLVIESALDQAGIRFNDGFTGTLTRTFEPASFDETVFVRLAEHRSQVVPIQEAVDLYKVHGSINWRFAKSPDGDSVVQQRSEQTGDEVAVIYPTPQKESDVLGYPYADLFRALGDALLTPEAALLVVGYGFGDAHVNRLIRTAIGVNSSLQMLALSPRSTYSLHVPAEDLAERKIPDLSSETEWAIWEDTPIGRIARARTPRVSVLAGPAADFKTFSRELLPDPDELARTARAEEAEVISALETP